MAGAFLSEPCDIAARRRRSGGNVPPECTPGGLYHRPAGAQQHASGLAQLFAQAGQVLHGGAGWFNRAREFPNTRHSELPIAAEADRAINEPVPLLQRYLPFWLAT
jgi:hypothetical protein